MVVSNAKERFGHGFTRAADAMVEKAVDIVLPGGQKVREIPIDTPVTPFEWFSGKGKARLREFISFCRAGAFVIG
jgi:hypothetical protein